jgi:hypothetical protein
MDANLAAAVAAVAACVTAIITAAIAVANYRVTLAAEKSYDFTACLTVVSQTAQALRLVRDSADKEFEFRELLNLLETLAGSVNDGLLRPSTLKMVEPYLIECYAYLRSQPSLKPLLETSVTGDGTFRELYAFASHRMDEVRKCIARYNSQIATDEVRPLGSAASSSADTFGPLISQV